MQRLSALWNDKAMTGWSNLNFWKNGIWQDVQDAINGEVVSRKAIFPAAKDLFRPLMMTPLQQVKVVILGQDPYHTPGAADGLAFSCPKDYRTPPSLVNIFKELQSDLKCSEDFKGPLDGWAKQGVLLINSVWTVKAHTPNSHALFGWQNLTREIISLVAEINNYCVFVFWGKHAQVFETYTKGNGWIIKSPHPSPYAASQGFFGSRPFSKINEYLITSGETPIDWSQVNDYEDPLFDTQKDAF